MNPHVLLIEAYTDANIGSGALVFNAIEASRHFDPRADIRVMAHYPEAFRQVSNVEAVGDVFHYPFGKARLQQALWLTVTLAWMAAVTIEVLLLPRTLRFLSKWKLRDLLWADTIISVGAERLNDKYPKNIAFSLFTYWIAKKSSRRMILFPCTIGPIFRRTTKRAVRFVLPKLDLVFVRDETSADIVRTLEACAPERLIQTTDVAILNHAAPHDARLLRDSLGIPHGRSIVGISAMRWTYVHNSRDTSFSSYAAYVEQMAALADRLIELYGVHVVFFPTNYPERGCRENDVSVCHEIRDAMAHKEAATVIEVLPSAAQLQAMLSLSEVNITTRMHACILSTAAAIPTLSINYLFKLRGYMETLGLGEFSIDIEDFNCEDMLRLFDRMWRERVKWKAHLELRVTALQTALWKDLEPIRAFV